MLMVPTAHRIFPTEAAAVAAAAANDDGEDFTFRVVALKDGKFVVALHDKDSGDFVGCLP